jgi:hypothetical protein
MSDCTACGHPLRNHHVVQPVSDRRARFRCACGCTLDGSAEPVCPRCGGDTDPAWYCSEGYCPSCCVEMDEGP